jgi:pyruvate kinase
VIRSRAGVSIPSERVTTPALTAKDRADIPRTRELAADLVAQSFVRRAEDVEELRQLLGEDGPSIVAKIETRAAVDDFDRILGVADAVMIARGDMGVELRDLEMGLVDFPGERDGAAVWLCWRLADPSVAFWHPTDEGYASRRPW